ncbi:MAG: hypothetical protein NWF06_00735 [Candidatus Bathyarchaeota archaeon]|nr:hypothetical protein [Candidatus Bathyarchaeum sp.]
MGKWRKKQMTTKPKDFVLLFVVCFVIGLMMTLWTARIVTEYGVVFNLGTGEREDYELLGRPLTVMKQTNQSCLIFLDNFLINWVAWSGLFVVSAILVLKTCLPRREMNQK